MASIDDLSEPLLAKIFRFAVYTKQALALSQMHFPQGSRTTKHLQASAEEGVYNSMIPAVS